MRQLGACLCGGGLKSLLCSPGLRWCERARGACHLARAERRIIRVPWHPGTIILMSFFLQKVCRILYRSVVLGRVCTLAPRDAFFGPGIQMCGCCAWYIRSMWGHPEFTPLRSQTLCKGFVIYFSASTVEPLCGRCRAIDSAFCWFVSRMQLALQRPFLLTAFCVTPHQV